MPDKSKTAATDSAANAAGGEVTDAESITSTTQDEATGASPQPREIGGRKGPDPTRYGDWEKDGRCIDF